MNLTEQLNLNHFPEILHCDVNQCCTEQCENFKVEHFIVDTKEIVLHLKLYTKETKEPVKCYNFTKQTKEQW